MAVLPGCAEEVQKYGQFSLSTYKWVFCHSRRKLGVVSVVFAMMSVNLG